ncbi:hypothetical protein SNOG_05035 [Parastagonospora nodorum SN15]|uniref:Uncharacterized protein n=1 Tax=Phaeosphaeria nodorum (strain SN15 / ATCC MYA-4574 / FGSC 10173) TaxID=321614 RepID=Q0UT79_PHANO|nr:hypothetical protein SNOG_05035 [Parastagonospora nodorum SN15]EAT87426.2 hypothetical protein SNOG_05035 [Parastagonospora nodorum SN15]
MRTSSPPYILNMAKYTLYTPPGHLLLAIDTNNIAKKWIKGPFVLKARYRRPFSSC